MNSTNTTNIIESSSTTKAFFITLIPCDNESSDIENEKSLNVSKDSIDSSEILDSSDDEIKIIKIKEIFKSNEMLDIIEEDKIKNNKSIISYNTKKSKSE